MIEVSNQFGKLSEEELSDFEEVNNISLPQAYRSFLLTYNGGEPTFKFINDTRLVLRYFLGMHNGDFYASMYRYIDTMAGRLPLGTFPIATDPFGNLFLMSVHPESSGQVYFWDHEGEPEVQDGSYTENTHFVAYSFEELLDKLK